MKRISLSESKKSEWVELFEDHDLSAAAFCRECSLPYSSFLKWRRELSSWPAGVKNLGRSKAVSRPVEFVEVIAESLPRRARDVVAELELGGGHVLRLFRSDR